LDKLWATAAEYFDEVKEEDTSILKELQTENLTGCVQFLKVRKKQIFCVRERQYLGFNAHLSHCFLSRNSNLFFFILFPNRIIPTNSHRIVITLSHKKTNLLLQNSYDLPMMDGRFQLLPKVSPSISTAGIVHSGRCPPPSLLLDSDVLSYRFGSESNTLLSLIAQRGGVDEVVLAKLQRMRDLQLESEGYLSATASSSSGSGSGQSSSQNQSTNQCSGLSSSSSRENANSSSSFNNNDGNVSNNGSAINNGQHGQSEIHIQPTDTRIREIEESEGKIEDEGAAGVISVKKLFESVEAAPINGEGSMIDTVTVLDTSSTAVAQTLVDRQIPRLLRSAGSELSLALTAAPVFVPSASSVAKTEGRSSSIGNSNGKNSNHNQTGSSASSSNSGSGSRSSGSSNVGVSGNECEPYLGSGPYMKEGIEVIHLGKRGRRYVEVWEEQDFIWKSNQGDSFKTLADWSELLKSYSDSHDGAYREWNATDTALSNKEINKELKKNSKYLKYSNDDCKKGSNKSTRVNELSSPSSFGDHNQVKKLKDFSKTGDGFKVNGFRVTAPPVPTTVCHPSCWGVSARQVAEESFEAFKLRSKGVLSVDVAMGDLDRDDKGLFECIHPAALSKTLVELPGTAAARLGLGFGLRLDLTLILTLTLTLIITPTLTLI
jgi:hypothetical protein